MNIFEKNVEYFKGDQLAAKVVVEKYLLQNENGDYVEETYDDICVRVAKEIIRIDQNYEGFHLDYDILLGLLKSRIIVPHGSLLFGVGNNKSMTTISNCFVLPPPKDSISGIMDAAKMMGNLYKARGGVGMDLSSLRPDKTPVRNSARYSTGAWSFASLYSAVTGSIGQCLAKDSWVLTKRGLVPIQDVVAGDQVSTKEGWVEVVKLHSNGKKPVKKVTICGGMSIRLTDDHIMSAYIPNPESRNDAYGEVQEKRLKDLNVESWVNLIPGNLEWESPNKDPLIPLELTDCEDSTYPISEAMAYYYGFFFAASSKRSLSINEKGEYEIYFNHRNELEVRPFRNFLRIVFGLQKYAIKHKKRWIFKIHEPIFMDWLRHIGAIREADEAGPIFPANFLSMGRELQQHFIAGFMQTQGHQGVIPTSFKGMGSVKREPLEKFQISLMAMGVYSQISPLMALGGYELNIIGAKSLDNFYQMYKHARWRPTYFFNKANKPMRKDSVMTPYSVQVTKTIVNPVSWRFFSKFKHKTHPIPLIRRRIETIFEDGIDETYDLELASEHWFWCNGFYVHNSGRRGALMLTLDVRHPDIEKFIECKLDTSRVTNANISVKFTDEFMKAVVNDTDFTLRWPIDSEKPEITRVVKAKDIWTKFLLSNQKSSEPGALFWDRMASYTPNASYPDFVPICVNPCAEVGMGSFSNCRLVSINLLPFVKNPFTDEALFDFDEFRKTVAIATQLLDNIVDIDIEKMKNIQNLSDEEDVKELWGKFIDKTERGREVGLGTLGVADMLACLQLRYGSEEAVKLVDSVYYNLAYEAYTASADMAQSRGTFPEYDFRVKADAFLKFNRLEHCLERRNISLLTCAPTGSISLITQTSSGIEPVFKNEYMRRKKVAVAKEGDFVGSDGQRYEEFAVVHRNVQKFKEMYPGKELPYYFVDAHAVLPEERIKMQEAAQRHIDHSISSTVQLPAGVLLDTMNFLYLDAWKRGLKGVTIYVDGSRDGILVTNKDKVQEPTKAMKRPEKLPCEIHHTTVQGQKWVVFVGLRDGKPYEAFCGLQEYVELSPKVKEGVIVKRKTKKAERGIYDLVVFEGQENEFVVNDIVNAFKNDEHMVMGRLVSLALRFMGRPSYVAEQLFKDSSSDFMTYNKVLARILKKYVKDGEKPEAGSVCGECGGEITYQEGCLICMNCGYSKCS